MKNVIAIDGPSASGKSTVARSVAAELKWRYVDSGALYRGVAWMALRGGVDVRDEAALVRMMNETRIEMVESGSAIEALWDGESPGIELRLPTVNEVVSPVAAAPGVRERVVALLRSMRRFGSLVVEGRDIGTVVFQDALFKFYLDASPVERARRRHAEMQEWKIPAPGKAEDVESSLLSRDRMDRSRGTAPLRVASDAVVIDSTGLGVDDVVALILKRVRDVLGSASAG